METWKFIFVHIIHCKLDIVKRQQCQLNLMFLVVPGKLEAHDVI